MQSAFRKHHSTETALIDIVDRMLLNLDDKRVNGLVFADFQKAFDLVHHEILIEKLRIYGLEDNSLDLVRSFLQNRTQRTVVWGAQSSPQALSHGVPQGSVLSPLLFLVHINDLPEAVSQPTTVDIFADYTTLSSHSPYANTPELCSRLCQSTLELEKWTGNNRFKLNMDKTKSMFVTGTRLRAKMDHWDQMEIRSSKGDVLETTTSHKLLGVYIDPDLSFNEHVEHLCKKLTKRIGVLRSIRHYLPLNERILFYNATIKPLFLYDGAIWSITSKANIRRVFRLQKRAARVILDVKTARDERTVDLFNKLDWLPFYEEINVNKLCLIFKCLHAQCPQYISSKLIRVSDVSVRSSRYGHLTLRCPKSNRATEGGKTFASISTSLWNSLPPNIRSCESINIFKEKCMKLIKMGYANIEHFPIS